MTSDTLRLAVVNSNSERRRLAVVRDNGGPRRIVVVSSTRNNDLIMDNGKSNMIAIAF
jgi:predicted transglutaminase-like cysteine proteinase